MSFEGTEFSLFMDDLSNFLNPKEESIVRLLVNNPAMINESGNANKSALASSLDIPWAEASRLLETLGEKLQNEL